MQQRREHPRVDVNIPVSVNLVRGEAHDSESWVGFVQNLSQGGMRIGLHVHLASIKSDHIHYSLVLPHPFNKVSGHGHIRWAYWNSKKRITDVGLKFMGMEDYHRKEINTILGELA